MSYADDVLNKYGTGVGSFASNIGAKTNDFYARQKTGMNDFVNRFSGAIKGQDKLGDMYSRIGKELNLPALYQGANEVNTQMANLPGTYNSATRGFDVNANQLNRIVSTKQAALAPAQESANLALANAQGELNTRIGFEQEQQAKELAPYQTEQQMLADYYARESTGFTQANGQELDGYIQKLNAGVTLSEGEKQRANQLAQAELSYKAAIETAKISAESNKYSTDKTFETNRQNRLLALASGF